MGTQLALRNLCAKRPAVGHCISILVPRSAKRSLAKAPNVGSSSSALGTRVATSTADASRTVGGDLLRSPLLIDRSAVPTAKPMLGNIPNSTNSAVLTIAVPSGIALCQPPTSSQLSVQMTARIVPKLRANLVPVPAPPVAPTNPLIISSPQESKRSSDEFLG